MPQRQKPVKIICAICQKPFETTATCVKNCPDCREVAKKNAKRKFDEKRASKRNEEDLIEFGDAPWQREICLSCELPDCKGWCDKLNGG